MQIQAHCVEGAGGIGPVGWSDNAFSAESEDLTANNDVPPALRGTADLNVRLPHVLGNYLIEEDMGILSLAEFVRIN